MDERRVARQRRRRQNQWAVAGSTLFLLGLLLGMMGGLYVAWVVIPGETNTAGVEVLRPVYQEDYLFMVSQSYAATGDWEQAAMRLARLQDPQIEETVVALLEQYLREGQPADQVRNMAQLAERLGANSPVLALFAPTPVPIPPTAVAPDTVSHADPTLPTATATLLPTPTPSATPSATPSPTATSTPLPTATPTAVPDYRLLQQDSYCETERPQPRLEIIVVDANLQPLPGVEIIVSWGDNQTDSFFTGFKPAQGLGFADFVMSADVSYTVSIAGQGEPISGLQAAPCADGAGLTGWRLRFQNLALDTEAGTEDIEEENPNETLTDD